MILIHHPAVEQFIQALCWTLIHSLWQGLAVAILAAIVLMSTRKSRPALRYNLLASLLVLFISGAGYTLWSSLDAAGEVARSSTESATLISWTTQQVFVNNDPIGQAWSYRRVISFLNTNAAWIVGVWLVIFLFRFSQAVGGMVHVKRIRTQGVHQVGERWQWQLRQLAQKIDIYERIGLIASERVRVPIVIGYLTPMIVVPIGFLTSMPLLQVEAILLHELAHIKRQDYLVNLLQSFVETLFFFNPALLWLSALIREEREHCCDDLAISVLRDKASLVNALVSFQEYHVAQASFAVAFAGKKNHLLERIKRIIYKNNKQLNAMEKLFIAAGCIVAIGLTVTISVSAPKKAAPKSLTARNTISASVKPIVMSSDRILRTVQLDTLPAASSLKLDSGEGVSTMHFTREGHRYEIVTDNGDVVYFKLDGKQIPREDIGKYQKEIQQFSGEIKESRMHAEHARKEADEMREKAEEQRGVADGLRHEAEELRKSAEVFRYNADRIRNENVNYNSNVDRVRKEANVLREQAEQFRATAVEMRKQAEMMRIDATVQKEGQIQQKVEAKVIQEKAQEMRVAAEAMRVDADKMRAQAEVHRQEAEVMRGKAEKMRAEFEKLQAELIGELVSEGIISTREGLSYMLDKNELVVNGKKQSDVIHKRFQSKYLKSDDVKMVYNWQGRTGYTTTGMIYSK